MVGHRDGRRDRRDPASVLPSETTCRKGLPVAVTGFKFTAAQLADIRRARRTLADLLPHLDSARKCGVDCAERELMREELDKLLENMELEYGGK
jgi:hypothetical protein